MNPFVIGLIESEIERNLTQRQQIQSSAKQPREFEGSPCNENEDLDDDTDKSEEQGMSMGM